MPREGDNACGQYPDLEAARAEYLTAFAREGAAIYAEHALAAAGDAAARREAFASGMDMFMACQTIVDLGFRRTLRARNAKQLHLAVAWLREGLRLETDAVTVGLKALQLSVQGQAELRCIEGAVREHARVQRTLALAGQSVQQTFETLQRGCPHCKDPHAVARWLGVADALDTWPPRQHFDERVLPSSLGRPKLVLTKSSDPSAMLIVQPLDGCYLTLRAPQSLRIALLRGEAVHELGTLTPQQAPLALARAGWLLAGVEPSAFESTLH